MTNRGSRKNDRDQVFERVAVQEVLSKLSKQQARVLTLRFGLDGTRPCTTREISEEMKICPAAVIDLELLAIQRVKKLWGDRVESRF